MLTKICFKCSTELPLSEFYSHPQMADGHLGKCKTCAKNDSEERRSVKSLDSEWVGKEMERHRIKQRKARLQGTACVLTREVKNQVDRRYRFKYPDKAAAHAVVSNASRDNKIERKPCEVCGEKAQAHHDDYSKPLEVRWLCPKHHSEHHVEVRRKIRLGIV